MAQDRLMESFWFDPFHGGDPGPEIWRLIRELDQRRQIEVAGVVIRTQIAVAEARVAGLKALGEVMTAVEKAD
jgi:hypothetical protein